MYVCLETGSLKSHHVVYTVSLIGWANRKNVLLYFLEAVNLPCKHLVIS